MVIEQNVQWSAVWNSEKKDFIGIVTIRDLLEMLVFIVDFVKESFARQEVSAMNEKPYIYYFLERYLKISSPLRGSRTTKGIKRIDSGIPLRQDLSIVPKILEQISLYEWFAVSQDIIKFHKSQLNEFGIDENLHTCLQHMNDNGLNFMAMLNNDRTLLQGAVSYQEIIKFLVENYTGDISFFEKPLVKFDVAENNLFPSYQKLVITRDTDTLFQVLKKMRDNRVSCIPVER